MATTASDDNDSPLEKAIGALGLRNIGPAFMGGRIADIAVDPHRPSTWYLGVGSGGVWKTTNAGTTWTSIFDDQGSFSIGCVTLDPSDSNTVWVGTGESVSGRHVAWGNGVYRSRNGGAGWDHMGLEQSEHIGAVLVDPRHSDIVYVAAEGPLWSSGGERGVYKSSDGGSTWQPVLQIDDDTGVTSLTFAPDNPDVLYAATYQRRRHVATFVGGGPGSGIHKSTDGGESWRRLSKGLPEGDMGKIGLAVTKADPNLVYATVEAAKEERGFYRSIDRGESWERRCDYISGGTGPHYYQEIFASPHDPERVFQVDVFLHRTSDGGKTFTNIEGTGDKHSDNHLVWIDPNDSQHLLIGTDAGLYESFDEGHTNRHFPNLPISQFYRVAVDNALPFFNILGGAQDLGTLYGPSRTTNIDGVRNQDWTVPLGADGYHAAFDPTDPDTSYMEWQVGNVVRFNHKTGERIDIQPQPAIGDPAERWNWDCPIVVSPHDSNRIYLASQRVWRSDDRGDSWSAISGDLTSNRDRYEMPTFGAVPSVDALYDHEAMSLFSTITDLCESTLVEGLLYVGTDDGNVKVSEDGGADWRAADVPAALPAEAFVNNVYASHHDSDVVFLAADDHKHGDYTPHLYRSNDRGRTWTSISGDLPDGTIIWAIEQDHVNPDLLFVAAEFALHVSVNGGGNWHSLSKNVPTISFRDVKLQRRDNDLVGASFGRGFFVLDDYSPLRTMSEESLAAEATLFPVRDAWWYAPELTAQAVGQPTLGSTAFRSDNPEFGATITFHLADDHVGPAKARQNNEAEQDAGRDVERPSHQALWSEHLATDPEVVLVIRNAEGDSIRRLKAPAKAGLHRVTWDLRLTPTEPISLEEPGFQAPWDHGPKAPLTAPGEYQAELVLVTDDGERSLSQRESFTVQPIPSIDDGSSPMVAAQFGAVTAELARRTSSMKKTLETIKGRIPTMRATVIRTAADNTDLHASLSAVHQETESLWRELVADPVKERLAEAAEPTVATMMWRLTYSQWTSTMPPTQTHQTMVERINNSLVELESRAAVLQQDVSQLTADLDAAGATWTPR